MRYAATISLIVVLTSVLAGCPRDPGDTAADTGDDTSDTDTGDTDTDTSDTDTDTDTADTDTDTDTDTADTDTGGTDRDVIITEVLDGDMYNAQDDDTNSQNGPFDRVPRFIELTNIGTTTEDLSEYTLALWRNGGMNGAGGTLLMEPIALTGDLAPDDSYVVSLENELEGEGVTGFFQVYGFEPDLRVKMSGMNGDDGFTLFYGVTSGDGSSGTRLDTFGVIGEDGTGTAWEYVDGYVCRTFSETVAPDAEFTISDWLITKDTLDEGSTYADNVKEKPLVLGFSTPGVWDAASCPPPGPECVTAVDCDPPANECMEAVCTPEGTCAEAPAPGLLDDVVPGDCSQPSCNSSGVLGTTNVDDPPADTFCVNNTCGEGGDDGVVVPVPQNVGNALPTGQTPFDCLEVVCSASGGTEPKNVDDPVADVTFCSDNYCDAGVNKSQPRNVGTALPDVPAYAGDPAQAPGDCQDKVCDNAGGVAVDTVDNNDDDPPQTECIAWICTDGAPDPSNTVPDGTALPDEEQVDNNCEELYCDALAAVQERLDNDDKPANTPCTTYACVTQGDPPSVTLLGNETVLTDAVDGNCHDTVCNGAGGTTDTAVVNVDDTAPDEVCALSSCNPDGTAGTPDPVASGEACNGEDGVCNGDGECVECMGSEQCPGSTCDLDTNTCAPVIVGSTPEDDDIAACVYPDLSIEFDKAMNPAKLTVQTTTAACVTTNTIQLSADSFVNCIGFTAAAPTMSAGNTIATLNPLLPLVNLELYELKVTTGAEAADGAQVAANEFVTFATSPARIVMSQIYGAGGNGGATYNKDFVELFNQCDVPVSLAGWTMQYTASTGPTTGQNWSSSAMAGTIPANSYFLVTQSGGSNGIDLPAIDHEVTASVLSMGAGGGKVALFAAAPTISTSCPTHPSVVDFVPFATGATSTCTEGTGVVATNPSTTLSVFRTFSGCKETNVTGTDFLTSTVLPRNSASPKAYCSSTDDVVLNEDDVPLEANYCGLISPATVTVQRNVATAVITGKVYELGKTDVTTGHVTDLNAQVGYGPLGSDPTTGTSWAFFSAPFDSDLVNDDVYKGTITAPVVSAANTHFAYTFRFTLTGTDNWTYCDLNGAGSDPGLTFETTQLGNMTVNLVP